MDEASSGRVGPIRIAVLAGCVAATLASGEVATAIADRPAAIAGMRDSQIRHKFAIAPQDLSSALQQWSVVSGRDWGYVGLGFGNTPTGGARGSHTELAALERILAGTGFTYRITPFGSVSIIRIQGPATA